MQLCIIFNRFFDQKIVDQLSPVQIISNNSHEPLNSITQWSMNIETAILDKYKKIDWVLYCVDSNILVDRFYKNVKFGYKKNSIFLTGNSFSLLDQNFYCAPHVLSYFGSHYKISTQSINDNVTDQNKLFYMAVRNNLELTYL